MWSAEIREKARLLRRKGNFLDDISEQLGIGRSTIYGWVRDMPFTGKSERAAHARELAVKSMQAKYAALRQAAYDDTDLSVLGDTLVRDFIVMYLGEGFRRCRNTVQICNTNPDIMRLSLDALKKLGCGDRLDRFDFKLLLYPDHSDRAKKRFWADYLGIKPALINVCRPAAKQKPVTYRRAEHGLMYMSIADTYLRSKLQALMDTVVSSWKQ